MTAQAAAPAGSTAPRKAIPLDEAIGTSKQEEDRFSLEPGCEPFYITDVFFSTETRYSKLAKINGIRSVDKAGDITNVVKFRTTSGPLVTQLEKLQVKNASGNGHFRIPVGPVTVINETSQTPDKQTGEFNSYYKLVAAPVG
jgi:hypothetical protein